MGGGKHQEWTCIFKRLAVSAVRRRGGGKSGSNKTKSKLRMDTVKAGGNEDGGQ